MGNKGKPSRRDFLKESCVCAGSTAAVLNAPALVQAAGSDRLKIGVVGCGGRGTGAVSDCLRVGKHIQLTAMADIHQDKAQRSLEFLKKMDYGDQIDVPEERIFHGFDAYQQLMACDVDMVLLCTPPGFRPIHYRAAIDAGKHVFLEKPVCIDAAGYRSLLETNRLADSKNRKVCVGHQNRHQDRVTQIVKRIQNGGIGKINLLEIYACAGTRPGKFPVKQPGQSEMEYQLSDRNWLGFTWLSGDGLVEGGFIHRLDVANWIMGTHPVEVHGMGGRYRPVGPGWGQDFDHYALEYVYEGGIKLICYQRNFAGCWHAGGLVAYGSEGVGACGSPLGLSTPFGRLTKSLEGIIGKKPWMYQGPGRRGHYNVRWDREREYVPPVNSGWHEEHIQWVDAITHDKPLNEAHWGAESSMTAVMGRMAAYSGQLIRWDEAVAKGPALMPEKLSWDMDPPAMPDEHGAYPVPVPGIYRPF